jgi:hypothetical protein
MHPQRSAPAARQQAILKGMLLNTFQVDLKPGDEPPFPDVRDFAKVSDSRS